MSDLIAGAYDSTYIVCEIRISVSQIIICWKQYAKSPYLVYYLQ